MTTEMTGEIRRTPTEDIPCLNRVAAIAKLQIEVLGHAEALVGTPLADLATQQSLKTFYALEGLMKDICDRPFALMTCPVPRGGVCAGLENRAKEGIK